MLYAILDKLLLALSGFITYILASRYLSTDLVGKYVLYHSILFIIVQVSSLGMKKIYIREYITGSTTIHRPLINLASSYFILFSISFSSYFLLNSISLVAVVILFISPLLSFQVFEWNNESKRNFKDIFISRLITFIFSSAFKFYCVKLGNIELLLLSYILETLLPYFFQISSAEFKKNSIYNSKIIRESLPILFATLSYYLYAKMSQWILAAYMSNDELAFYAISVKITEPFSIFATAISSFYFSKIVKEYNERKEYSNLNRNIFNNVSFSMIVLVFLLLFGDKLLLIFGSEYVENSLSSTRILAFTIPFIFINSAISNYLVCINKQNIILIRTLLGVPLVSGLCLLLIPILGVDGAALSTLITISITNFFVYFFVPEVRSRLIWKK
ncbi:polysaccharide biosynthesis C-terminal domain-containing protein [Vibrio splendidus]|uniref:oligosaccharide flippase family protein n=1 Tax=Vibrio splendidus TaxID=29497 RepID=UPI000D379F98|nr:polysaccharide biosynthesis C-terminal domain-containing protein [Vibrio splendidus]PTP57014.1 hypothetical protein CWN83_05675 [Vibrio splendidus]